MKNYKKILVILLFIVILTGCTSKKNDTPKDDVKPDTRTELEKKVDSTLEGMTLDEKIGQMLMIFYRKDTVDSTLESALKDVKPGGFILFKENISTYDKTLNFIKTVKNSSSIPMFISIDQEGGNVQRLLALQDMSVSNIPYMYDVGLKNDENLASDVGKVIAEELRVFGINMDFAPDVDVYSNKDNKVIGKRSFGTNSDIVSRLGISLGNSLSKNGVIPVYKHFPGHGNTATDSHVSLPIVDKTKEELYSLDLIPFQKAIEENAPVIMVGHLAVPSITGDNTPASISKALITDFLKGEMGYKGLVVTDALNMNALTNYYSQDEIYVKAVEAGVDILLMPSSSRNALNSVKKAVEDGRITEERINESVKKILTLKYEKIEENYNEYLPSSYLNSKEHQEILKKVK